jgi:hypothetical protein
MHLLGGGGEEMHTKFKSECMKRGHYLLDTCRDTIKMNLKEISRDCGLD